VKEESNMLLVEGGRLHRNIDLEEEDDLNSDNDLKEEATKLHTDFAYCSGNGNIPCLQPSPDEEMLSLNEITHKLVQEKLWKEFSRVGNEMIVTRLGR